MLQELVGQMKRRMDVAHKEASADLLIRNANVVNVFLKQVIPGDVAVCDGHIAGIFPAGEGPEAEKVIDAKGEYLLPGLIDAHTHVEMCYASPVAFAEYALPWGTTTAVMDPHDTVNAMGNQGLKVLSKEFEATPMKILMMTPPCVPSAPALEDAGFEVTADSLKETCDLPLIHGIAETMDFTRVLGKEEEIMNILAFGRSKGMLIDGHAPEVRGEDAQAYFGTGPIRTDHESVTIEEMYEKYSLGVHVVIRRGSLAEPASAGELVKLLPDTSRLLLATDGCINVHDLVHKGHMNYALRQIVAEGVDPMTAIQMGTINVARAYRVDHRIGAIAPGYEADMLLVKDLTDFETTRVFCDGKEIPRDLKLERMKYPESFLNSVKFTPLKPEDLRISAPEGEDSVKVRVMRCVDQTLVTVYDEDTLEVKDGAVYSNTEKDILKGITLERYGRGKGYGLGLIRGYHMKNGAIAGSIGQDSQNIAAIGVSDEDICLAVNTIQKMQGGVVLVADGKVLATIPMPIFGIMSDKPLPELEKEFADLQKAYEGLGGTLTDAVFTLSLLVTLAVIPEGALSNRGLVDVANGQLLDVIIK